MQPNDPRKNNFDLVRLLAALCVAYGHAFILAGQTAPGFAANAVSTLGVKVFFAISGYLVATSWLSDPHLGRYFMKRALRIFPALIVVTLLAILVLGPLVTRLSLAEYLRHPFTFSYLHNIRLYISYILPGVFEANIYPNAVNGNLWSLPVEFAMYIVTPLAIMLLASRPRPADAVPSRFFLLFAIAYCLAAFYFSALRTPPPRVVFYATDLSAALQVSPYFVVGMAFAICRLDRFLNVQAALLLVVLFAAIGPPPPYTEAALIVLLPYVVISFAVSYLPVSRYLKGRDISYGLFLYSFPVQQLLIWAGVRGGWQLLASSLLVCLPLAYASWMLIEKRALELKPAKADSPAKLLAS